MSLINDMLRDLDRRSRKPAVGHAAILQGLGLAGMPDRRPPRWRVPVLAGIVLCIGLVVVASARDRLDRQQVTPGSGRLEMALAIPPAQPPVRAAVTATAQQVEATATAVTGDEQRPAATANGQAHRTASTAAMHAMHSDTAATREQRPAATASGQAPRPANTAAMQAMHSGTAASGTNSQIEVIQHPLSREQQLANDLRVAATAHADGDDATAERLLVDLLVRDNGLHRARLMLAGLYLKQQQHDRAESVLTDGLLHHPQHAPYARLYAQLLAAQARDSEAIDILQAALHAAGNDAEFHALLAGLYQRNGKPGAAVDSYRMALRLAPAHGAWWVGLGISSDQAGDTGTAASAYRQALHYPLATAVREYAHQRLAQLLPAT